MREPSPRGLPVLRLSLVLLAGCPSLLTMGPARTVPPGKAQEFVSAGAYRATLVSGTPPEPVDRSVEWIPFAEAGVRFGLGESVDLSIRAGTGGGSIGPRIQVLRSASQDSGVDVLVDPSIGWTGFFPGDREGVVTGMTVSLALPVGWNIGGGSQLVLSPRVALVNDRAVGPDAMAGASLGLVLALGTGPGSWLLSPECALASSRRTGDPVLQCGLGLFWPR